jgi:hypothetical protein
MVVMAPVPPATTIAVTATHADIKPYSTNMGAHAHAVTDMRSGADAAYMGACADIAVSGLSTGSDGADIGPGADLRRCRPGEKRESKGCRDQ